MILPTDHETKMDRVRLSLDGLSIGDAFGQGFFMRTNERAEEAIAAHQLPAAPWYYTDDTEMALSIVECLDRFGRIERDFLAEAFARRYARSPNRGYGGTAHDILRAIAIGEHWQAVAPRVFSGSGSMGNGAAMRSAPVGAYFSDDLQRVVEEAKASAEPTHAHPDGQAGAIAVALAAALAVQRSHASHPQDGRAFLRSIADHTPEGETHQGILKALDLSAQEFSIRGAAKVLGSGYRVISSDTVPFALYCASLHFDDYRAAMWSTVAGLGDRDTTCAIVGGIIALSAGRARIPEEWLSAREPLVF